MEASDAAYRFPPPAPLPSEAADAADTGAASSSAVPSSTADGHAADPSPHVLTRLSAMAALATLVAAVGYVAVAVYLAFTDAWIAPLQLSPDSREVVNMRLQHAKEQRSLAELDSELVSIEAELGAIDVALQRLKTLRSGYSGAMSWSTTEQTHRLRALRIQQRILRSQHELRAHALAVEDDAVRRAQEHPEAGLITAAELRRAKTARERARMALSEVELEQSRLASRTQGLLRARQALSKASAAPASATRRNARTASPDVVRFDDVQVDIDLQLTRLEAERRAARARRRAVKSSLRNMRQLREQLESKPLFRAMQQDIDLAFVPYGALAKLEPGDSVVACRWLIFSCRTTGTVKKVLPGEVVTEDPWRSLARGQYVELEMRDRSALTERSLRVRERTGQLVEQTEAFLHL